MQYYLVEESKDGPIYHHPETLKNGATADDLTTMCHWPAEPGELKLVYAPCLIEAHKRCFACELVTIGQVWWLQGSVEREAAFRIFELAREREVARGLPTVMGGEPQENYEVVVLDGEVMIMRKDDKDRNEP